MERKRMEFPSDSRYVHRLRGYVSCSAIHQNPRREDMGKIVVASSQNFELPDLATGPCRILRLRAEVPKIRI